MAEEAKTIRAVLLGKTGAGKSSTGNTLLERDCFRVARGLKSGTEKCQWADAEIDCEDVILQVTDTPGVSDTHREEADVLKEVGKSIAVASPGPHVILMVMRCDTRFTAEEFLAYVTLKELFGPAVKDYMILVFVGIDNFDGDTPEEQSKNFQKEMKEATGSLRIVLEEAQWRFFGINNKASAADKRRQTVNLIRMMKVIKGQHGGGYFKNSVSDHVNGLVRPLVNNRVTQGHMTQSEAVRQTNRAIVEETEPSDFFGDLFSFVGEKVMPVMKQGLKVAKEAYELYGVAKKECAVM